VVVNRAREKLLTHSGLAADQDGGRRIGHPRYPADRLRKRRAFPHQHVQPQTAQCFLPYCPAGGALRQPSAYTREKVELQKRTAEEIVETVQRICQHRRTVRNITYGR